MLKFLKGLSKKALIRLVSGVVLGITAVSMTLGFMLPSYLNYQTYYNAVMAEKKQQEYLNGLPFEFLGISAELSPDVTYYDFDNADPIPSDFIVKANFTEKGKDFSKKLAASAYTISVPEDFAKNGGEITINYSYQPESTGKDKDGKPIYPDPIPATTKVACSLVEPPDTMYKLTKTPTYTEVGEAENKKGNKQVLPVLNDTDYSYVEYMSDGYAKFVYEAAGVTIRVPLTDVINVTVNGKKQEFNNVNCYFAANYSAFKMTFEDGSFAFSAKGSETAELNAIDGVFVTNSAVTFMSGSFKINGSVKVKGFNVTGAAKAEIIGSLTTADMLVEEKAEFSMTSGGDAIKFTDGGSVKFYGKVSVTSSAKGENTAMLTGEGTVMEIFETTRVTISDFEFGITSFTGGSEYWKMVLPNGAEVKKEAPRWVPVHIVLNGVDLVAGKNDTDLALWRVKYEYRSNGLTEDFNESTNTYTYTIEKGRKVSVSVPKNVNVVVQGEGVLQIAGEVNTANFIVKAGATVEASGVFSTVNMLVEEGATFTVSNDNGNTCMFGDNGEIKWYGTVNVIRSNAADATAIVPGQNSVIELGENSRVTITNFYLGLCRFGGSNATLKLPANAVRDGNVGYKMGENYLLKMVNSANGMGLWRVTVTIGGVTQPAA